jgi:hypothetical protein
MKSKRTVIRNLSICFRKGYSGEVEESEEMFQDGVRCTEE